MGQILGIGRPRSARFTEAEKNRILAVFNRQRVSAGLPRLNIQGEEDADEMVEVPSGTGSWYAVYARDPAPLTVNTVITELNRYLYVAARAQAKGHRLPPPVVLDEFWHAFILDTERYYEYCTSCFGGPVHHDPLLPTLDSVAGMEGNNPFTLLSLGKLVSEEDVRKYRMYEDLLRESEAEFGPVNCGVWYEDYADCG